MARSRPFVKSKVSSHCSFKKELAAKLLVPIINRYSGVLTTLTTNGIGFPSCIVTTWIRAVELPFVESVPAGI